MSSMQQAPQMKSGEPRLQTQTRAQGRNYGPDLQLGVKGASVSGDHRGLTPDSLLPKSGPK
ncbi:hypothetical protein D623_10035360 [Myotis brandtii]|uniref:Uncharacterized protein n=1 Tax=Myotis brandtii TaxID=109478 RepID=S7PCC9_MYOBR|nr:hypothetical protein D623_10035360 [Myotis brandtii]